MVPKFEKKVEKPEFEAPAPKKPMKKAIKAPPADKVALVVDKSAPAPKPVEKRVVHRPHPMYMHGPAPFHGHGHFHGPAPFHGHGHFHGYGRFHGPAPYRLAARRAPAAIVKAEKPEMLEFEAKRPE